jgi:hypothetical protein
LGESVGDVQIEAMHGGDPTVLVTSDSSGAYTIRGLAAQQYVIRATRNGYNVRNQDVTLANDMRLDIVMARNQVAVGGSLTEAAPCSARIDDARVEIVDGPDAGKWVLSGSSGYGIARVSWGSFRLRASKSGYSTVETMLNVPPPIAIDGASARQNFELQSTVPRFSMIGNLRNRMVETGGAVNGALVEIVGGPNAGRSAASANGSYQFQSLIAGATPLRVSHPDYLTETQEGAGARVCADGARWDIRLTPIDATLNGIVSDARSGGPVQGALVQILDGAPAGKSAVTDGSGAYAIAGISGSFTVRVSRQGYATVERMMTTGPFLAGNFQLTPGT